MKIRFKFEFSRLKKKNTTKKKYTFFGRNAAIYRMITDVIYEPYKNNDFSIVFLN